MMIAGEVLRLFCIDRPATAGQVVVSLIT